MSTSHPTPELLERLVAGELGETEALRLTWHLHHCDECRTVVELRPSGRDTLAALLGAVELEPLDPAPSYDDVITRTYDALMDRESDLERDRNQAPLLYEELLRHPAARQRVLIDNTRRFHSWGLVELLLANSQREYFNDARIAEELGRLALLIAERLDPNFFSDCLLADLKARCWVHIANSQRIRGDLPAAEQSFGEAEVHLDAGTDDPLERANFLRIRGALLRDQRHFQEAEAELLRSIAICRKVGDSHLAGKTKVALATLYSVMDEPDRAFETLREAQTLVEPGREPNLELGIRHQAIVYLLEKERYMEARAELVRCRDLFERQADPSLKRRNLWLQGLVARGLGQLAQAEAYLLKAREMYLELEHHADAALISLELAAVYALEGRTAEVKELAREVLPYFQAANIHREALAAILIFREAAEADTVSLALVREVARRLRETPEDPGRQFLESS
ncbi:MAG: hypothetical protein U0002_11165 [Thermoanaerobaculia bacterium]